MSVDSIKTAVERCVADWFGPGATVDAGSSTTFERPFSFLLHFPVHLANSSDSAVYVRITRQDKAASVDMAIVQSEAATVATQRYFDNASAIAGAFVDTDFEFVRPLAHWPRFNAVVTEALPSQSLRDLLNGRDMTLSRRAANARFAGYLEMAGEWLRVYHHKVGHQVVRPYSHLDVSEEISDSLARLRPYLRRKSPLIRIESQLESLSKFVVDEPIAWGQPHGDLHYANILVAHNQRLAVLDANTTGRSRPVFFDLAKLMVDPVTTSRQLVSLGLLVSRRRSRRFARAVAKGYFADTDPPVEVMQYFLVLAIVDKWVYVEKRQRETGFAFAPLRLALTLVRRNYFAKLCRRARYF